jgi:hypothetical protein
VTVAWEGNKEGCCLRRSRPELGVADISIDPSTIHPRVDIGFTLFVSRPLAGARFSYGDQRGTTIVAAHGQLELARITWIISVTVKIVFHPSCCHSELNDILCVWHRSMIILNCHLRLFPEEEVTVDVF